MSNLYNKYQSCLFVLSFLLVMTACQTDTSGHQTKEAELERRIDSLRAVLGDGDKPNEPPLSAEPTPIPPNPKPKGTKPKVVPQPINPPKPKVVPQPIVEVPTYTLPDERPSRNEPPITTPSRVTPPTSSSNEMNLLIASIKAERGKMLQAKSAAASLNAKELVALTFNEALQKEQIAEENAKRLTSTALKEAQSAFISARELFQKAGSEAEQFTATQIAAQTAADNAKNAMMAMRQSISNGSRNLKTLSSYQEAIAVERQGDEQYESTNFSAAKDAYIRAEILYQEAKETIVKAVPKNDNKVEERKIQIKIDSYGQLLEVGDIQGLLQQQFINRKEQNGWSALFNNVENISVKISNKVINIENQKASASFSVKMFYRNKTNKKVEENGFLKKWELEQRNNRWVIIP